MLPLVETGKIDDLVGWLAYRMTKRSVQDAIVSTYGDRGSGKSYANGYLAERLAKRLYSITGRPEEEFFTVDNVRSVDPKGTMEMFSSEQLTERKNKVFIVDDIGITANARSWNSPTNKRLNAILTIARIYRHCIIMNTVSAEHLDVVARGYADIGLHVLGVIPGTTINKIKVYKTGHTSPMGFGKNMRKTSHGKFFQLTYNDETYRMLSWYTNKPSEKFCEAYDKLRKENSDALIKDVMNDKQDSESVIEKKQEKKENKRAEKIQQLYNEYYDDVLAMYLDGDPMAKIARELGITKDNVSRIVGKIQRDSNGNSDIMDGNYDDEGE